jgi:hypothetical protein
MFYQIDPVVDNYNKLDNFLITLTTLKLRTKCMPSLRLADGNE